MSDLADQIEQSAGEVQQQPQEPTVFDLIGRMRGELAKALPAHVGVDRFLRIALTELRQTPRLQECTEASLLGALMMSARLGLEPGGPLGQFYLTPRYMKVPGDRNGHKAWQVVPIVGYQGLRDLAYQSGHVDSIQAVHVREGDKFRRWADADRGICFEWEPAEDDDDSRELRGVLAVAKIKNAGTVWRYLTKSKIDERRARGSAGDKGPWESDYDSMALKTGLRDLSKDTPKSTRVAEAVKLDESVQLWTPDQHLAIEGATS